MNVRDNVALADQFAGDFELDIRAERRGQPDSGEEDLIEKRLMCGSTYSDWLCAETMGKEAFKHTSPYDAIEEIRRHPTRVEMQPTHNLHALMFVCSNKDVLLAVRDEIAGRYLRETK